jgi:hypothetical protein
MRRSQDANDWPRAGAFCKDLGGIVRRTVVDDYYSIGLQGLAAYAGQALPYKASAIADGNDDVNRETFKRCTGVRHSRIVFCTLPCVRAKRYLTVSQA